MLGKVVPEEDRVRIVSLRRTHKLSCKEVGEMYGIHPDHVSRMVKEIERTGDTSVGRIGGDYTSGETLVLLEPTKELLEKDPSCTHDRISEFWSEEHGVVRTPRQVCNFLKKHGLESDSRKRLRHASGAGKKRVAKPDGRMQKGSHSRHGFF